MTWDEHLASKSVYLIHVWFSVYTLKVGHIILFR